MNDNKDEVLEYVLKQLDDGNVLELAKAYTGDLLLGNVVEITTIGYEEAFNNSEMSFKEFVDDFPLENFMYQMLEDNEKIKRHDYFDSEEVANNEGYYWYSEYDKWIFIK